MKTKEIKVWVHSKDIDDSWYTICNIEKYTGDTSDMVKARLIIEQPERKAELTESLIGHCIADFIGILDSERVAYAEEMKKRWIEKLFSKDGQRE